MKMTQFAKFANNATQQILGTSGLIRENLQSMFSYPDAINVLDPVTVSGNLIHIEDGAPLDAKRATIYIEPLQAGSGAPSPNNVRPISGWTGATVTRTGINAWDEEWEHGQYAVQTGEKIPSSVHIRCKYPIPVKPNTEYFYSTNGYNINVCYLDADMEYLGNFNNVHNVKKTTPDNCYYVVFNMAQAYGLTYNHDISINYPATDTTYHPYVGTTIPINFPSEAGTVYGGTLDMTTGVLTVDRNIITLRGGFYKHPTLENTFYQNNVLNDCVAGKCVSNLFAYSTIAFGNMPFGCFTIDINYTRIVIRTNDDMTADEFNAMLYSNPLTIVYPLATPTTYQLTPTNILMLNGINTIYADCGSMELEYYRREQGEGYLND